MGQGRHGDRTWTTWGRVDFTELKHLKSLEQWRLGVLYYACECELGLAGPLKEAHDMFGVGEDWVTVADEE